MILLIQNVTATLAINTSSSYHTYKKPLDVAGYRKQRTLGNGKEKLDRKDKIMPCFAAHG